MSERRMFAKTITESDAFLDMPFSCQALYMHLGMNADDDGFVNNPKTLMRMIGAKEDDMKVLIAKKFIIPFESGVVVIKHWKINNTIQSDRKKITKYSNELAMLELDENKSYRLVDTVCIQTVSEVETQSNLNQIKLNKNNINHHHHVSKGIDKDDDDSHKRQFIRNLLSDSEHDFLRDMIPKFDDREEVLDRVDDALLTNRVEKPLAYVLKVARSIGVMNG